MARGEAKARTIRRRPRSLTVAGLPGPAAAVRRPSAPVSVTLYHVLGDYFDQTVDAAPELDLWLVEERREGGDVRMGSDLWGLGQWAGCSSEELPAEPDFAAIGICVLASRLVIRHRFDPFVIEPTAACDWQAKVIDLEALVTWCESNLGQALDEGRLKATLF